MARAVTWTFCIVLAVGLTTGSPVFRESPKVLNKVEFPDQDIDGDRIDTLIDVSEEDDRPRNTTSVSTRTNTNDIGRHDSKEQNQTTDVPSNQSTVQPTAEPGHDIDKLEGDADNSIEIVRIVNTTTNRLETTSTLPGGGSIPGNREVSLQKVANELSSEATETAPGTAANVAPVQNEKSENGIENETAIPGMAERSKEDGLIQELVANSRGLSEATLTASFVTELPKATDSTRIKQRETSHEVGSSTNHVEEANEETKDVTSRVLTESRSELNVTTTVTDEISAPPTTTSTILPSSTTERKELTSRVPTETRSELNVTTTVTDEIPATPTTTSTIQPPSTTATIGEITDTTAQYTTLASQHITEPVTIPPITSKATSSSVQEFTKSTPLTTAPSNHTMEVVVTTANQGVVEDSTIPYTTSKLSVITSTAFLSTDEQTTTLSSATIFTTYSGNTDTTSLVEEETTPVPTTTRMATEITTASTELPSSIAEYTTLIVPGELEATTVSETPIISGIPTSTWLQAAATAPSSEIHTPVVTEAESYIDTTTFVSKSATTIPYGNDGLIKSIKQHGRAQPSSTEAYVEPISTTTNRETTTNSNVVAVHSVMTDDENSTEQLSITSTAVTIQPNTVSGSEETSRDDGSVESVTTTQAVTTATVNEDKMDSASSNENAVRLAEYDGSNRLITKKTTPTVKDNSSTSNSEKEPTLAMKQYESTETTASESVVGATSAASITFTHYSPESTTSYTTGKFISPTPTTIDSIDRMNVASTVTSTIEVVTSGNDPTTHSHFDTEPSVFFPKISEPKISEHEASTSATLISVFGTTALPVSGRSTTDMEHFSETEQSVEHKTTDGIEFSTKSSADMGSSEELPIDEADGVRSESSSDESPDTIPLVSNTTTPTPIITNRTKETGITGSSKILPSAWVSPTMTTPSSATDTRNAGSPNTTEIIDHATGITSDALVTPHENAASVTVHTMLYLVPVALTVTESIFRLL